MAKSEREVYVPAAAPLSLPPEARNYLDQEFERIALSLRLNDIDLTFGGLGQFTADTYNMTTTPQTIRFSVQLPTVGLGADVANNQIVITRPGTFFAAITVNMETPTNAVVRVEAYLNGVATGRFWDLKLSAAGGGVVSFSSQTLAIANAGDVLEYRASADGNRTVDLLNINLVVIRLTSVIPE